MLGRFVFPSFPTVGPWAPPSQILSHNYPDQIVMLSLGSVALRFSVWKMFLCFGRKTVYEFSALQVLVPVCLVFALGLWGPSGGGTLPRRLSFRTTGGRRTDRRQKRCFLFLFDDVCALPGCEQARLLHPDAGLAGPGATPI